MATRQRGTITRLIGERGFAFAHGADGQDYFLHHTSMRDGGFDRLQVGAVVTFLPVATGKGMRGEQVEPLAP